jgi:hypothetical protein
VLGSDHWFIESTVSFLLLLVVLRIVNEFVARRLEASHFSTYKPSNMNFASDDYDDISISVSQSSPVTHGIAKAPAPTALERA